MDCRRGGVAAYLCLFAIPAVAEYGTTANQTFTNSTTSETTVTVIAPARVHVNKLRPERFFAYTDSQTLIKPQSVTTNTF